VEMPLKVYAECIDGYDQIAVGECGRHWGTVQRDPGLGAYWAWTPANCR
jgi:hypothetical protein